MLHYYRGSRLLGPTREEQEQPGWEDSPGNRGNDPGNGTGRPSDKGTRGSRTLPTLAGYPSSLDPSSPPSKQQLRPGKHRFDPVKPRTIRRTPRPIPSPSLSNSSPEAPPSALFQIRPQYTTHPPADHTGYPRPDWLPGTTIRDPTNGQFDPPICPDCALGWDFCIGNTRCLILKECCLISYC